MIGITSAREETSHRVTTRPCRATLASRKTSRRCSCIGWHQVWDAPGPDPRAFLRHGGVRMRQGVAGPSGLPLAAPLALLLEVRSAAGDHHAIATPALRLVHRRVGARDGLLRRVAVRRILRGADAHAQLPAAELLRHEDRKSTRLNS